MNELSPVKSERLARAPMLLGNAGYYGTLAATRSLGRAGIPVVTLDPSAISPGRYSRYSSAHMRCPPFEQTKRWIEWLLNAQKSLAGGVIYATSDAVSYALAKAQKELSSAYVLLQPDLETMMCVLDKGQLLHHAHAVGIDTPETWLPRSRKEAQEIANDIPQSLLVKPRSQLAIGNYAKGALTRLGPNAPLEKFDQIVNAGAHDPDFARNHPEVMVPLLQVYYPEATERVYSLSGFRDRTGAKTAVLAAVKVMQRPKNLGVGLCFEDADVDQVMASKIFALCERIGYYGAFEAEFIQTDGRFLLIDFNARFYNQISLDVARGLDLPRLIYASATGDDDTVDALIRAFEARQAGRHYAFCNSTQFGLITRVRRSFGSMSADELRYWQLWLTLPARTMVDATFDNDDYLPYLIDIASQLFLTFRHLRSFLRDCRA